MSKAASLGKMNSLHDKIADIFLTILNTYAKRMDVVDKIDKDEVEDEILKQLFDEAIMPAPAMLTAVTKFLKDNDVLFEKDKIDEISETRKALEEKARNRPKLADLTIVPGMVAQ